jgi:hypothetical protein
MAAVVAESALPKPKRNTVDGNARFYGFECQNMGDGKDPWPVAQLDTMAIVSYVLCKHHKWTERSVVGHLEWQVGKIDPRGPGVSMSGIRTATGSLLRGATVPKPTPPKPKPKPPTKPTPPPSKPPTKPTPPKPTPLTVEQRLAALEARVTKLGG